MKKTLAALTLTVLASLAVVSAASADTVVIHRHGFHRPYFHHHFDRHFDHHRTVIIHR